MKKNTELLEASNEYSNKAFFIALEKFVTALNRKPTAADIKTRQNVKYLPISSIEASLDQCFAGLWQTKNMQWKLIANEIVVSIDLEVFNPIANVWISRSGVGAAQMRQRSGAEITDINAKIKNTLEMDIPHAKADAIKNAAKSLGALFGRNLTRKESDTKTYESIILSNVKKLAKREEAAQDKPK